VEVVNRYGAMVDKVAETLRENGVSDDVIGEVLKDMASEAKEVSVSSGYKTTDRIGAQGYEEPNNTAYGNNAGSSITTGDLNSFFGINAGMDTETGNYNVFVGAGSG
jgi:hypothetical protein